MKHRGVALIWTLILSTILIIISTTMVSYIVKDSQFSVRIEESTKVYAAARSGIEWASWYIEEYLPQDTLQTEFDFAGENGLEDPTSTVVIITPLPDRNYEITSESNHNNVTRKLKYTTSSNLGTFITPVDPISSTVLSKANPESFSMQFDFWTIYPYQFKFGLQNPATGDRINLSLIDLSGVALEESHAGKITTSPIIFDPYTDTPDNAKPYIYRAKIRYIKDTAAQLTLYKRSDDGSYTCLGSEDLDLSGINFGNLSNLYISTTSGTRYKVNGPYADGSYIEIYSVMSYKSDSLSNLIDNILIKY